MPVKKPKQPMIWNCTVCQVQAASEQDLQKHYAEQKHLSNVATLDPRTNASDQKAQTTAETSLGTEQKKTPSINWSCSTCQANGTSQSTLESHLKGKKHQQNITATCLEGNMDGMPKNIPTQEAKSHGINVPKNYPTTKASDQKPKLAAEQKKISSIEWSCSTCQANGTSHSTFEAHLKGKRHQQNITATFLQGNMDGMPKNIPAQETKSHGINLPKNSEKPCPFITEKPMAQEFDELPESNKVSVDCPSCSLPMCHLFFLDISEYCSEQ
jgi:phage-related protein